ncbi:MAG: glycosyltransferase family 2 protein, partial [Phormidium sp.]
SNLLVRREFIDAAGKFDPELKSAEDWDYYIRLAARCQFVLVPKYQILYRRSSGSMTSKVDVMEHYIVTVTERAFQQAPEKFQDLKKQSLAYTYRFLSQLCIAHVLNYQGIKQASQKLQKAITLSPKILSERQTIRLVLKVGIMRLIPYQLSKHFTRLLGKLFPDSSTKNLAFRN